MRVSNLISLPTIVEPGASGTGIRRRTIGSVKESNNTSCALHFFTRAWSVVSYAFLREVRDSLGFRRRFLSFGKDRGFGFDGIVDVRREGGRTGCCRVRVCVGRRK
jgi:hypothetical protein